MPNSESEDDVQDLDDADFDDVFAEEDGEDELLVSIENAADDATEGDPESDEDDSDDGDDSEEEDEEPLHHHPRPPPPPLVDAPAPPLIPAKRRSPSPPLGSSSRFAKSPTPPSRRRALSPAEARRNAFWPAFLFPRSYTVEAICALPHPVPTHSLAASTCMLHLLTGSEDGYVRDYDIFSAVNGKVFLTAPQRHHAGVVEGIMKSGQLRSWWENPVGLGEALGADVELSPVHSLALQADALWGLAGSNTGSINLFTVRHEPGRLFKSMPGHRGPVSALALQHDEMGFFSAGWDGDALQWDLNTGGIVRRFTAHGAQLAALAVRPLASDYPSAPPPSSAHADQMTYHVNLTTRPQDASTGGEHPQPLTKDATDDTLVTASTSTLHGTFSSPPDAPHHSGPPPSADPAAVPQTQPLTDADADEKSDASFDPLFDDEPDADGELDTSPPSPTAPSAPPLSAPPQGPALQPPTPGPGPSPFGSASTPAAAASGAKPAMAAVPKNAPPLLDRTSFAAYSPDVLMTAAMDGQVVLWDCRVATPSPGRGVGRLWMSEKTPPWCLSACWSMNGAQIYAGRRNGTIDVWDVRQLGRSGPSEVPRLLKTLRNPVSSGVVSCVAAFPDGRHIACASNDNIRLWNAAEAGEGEAKGRVQFKIIPGHHGGIVSQMVVDRGGRFLVSASGNRGWHGDATRTVFVHDIKAVV